MNEYFKVHAYASLYKIGRNGKSYDPEDITITMIRSRKPVKLMKWLQGQGGKIEQPYKGIYYITGAGYFTTQIIVSN